LFDAYLVPKLLSQQLLPFGRSGDELGELTFGVEQFLPLSVRRGQSARWWRTVRVSSVLRVLAQLRFRSVLVLSFGWTKFQTVRSRGADSPRVPGGRSACSPRTVRFSGFATGGYVCFNGQSAAQGRTVRGTGADSLRQQAGQSVWPVRTVRPSWQDGPPEPGCFALLFDYSLLSFVLPRVLQGIVPKT
jgi:hypothetical protein